MEMAKEKMSRRVIKEIPRFFLLIAVVLVSVVFGIIQPRFFSMMNLMNIICTASIVGTMALGATIVLSSGEMNFNLGAEATIAAAVMGVLLGNKTVPWYPAAVAVGLLCTLLVGYVSTRFIFGVGLPSFIVTLAMSKLGDGLINLIGSGKSIYYSNWPKSFSFLGQTRLAGIPVLLLVFTATAILCWLLMDKTKLGRHISAVGANQTACKQAGINIRRIKVTAFLLSSGLAGFAGILGSSQVNNVPPLLGSGLLMNAMASAMLGATFLRPGRFNIQGTIVATLLMTVIQNGIIGAGAPNYLCDIVQGVILVISVGIIAMTRKEGLPSVSFG